MCELVAVLTIILLRFVIASPPRQHISIIALLEAPKTRGATRNDGTFWELEVEAVPAVRSSESLRAARVMVGDGWSVFFCFLVFGDSPGTPGRSSADCRFKGPPN